MNLDIDMEDVVPRFKVFCFPHAGGGAHSFEHWEKPALAQGVELVRLSYPGAAPTSNVERSTSLWDVAWRLLPQIIEELDRPFVFFGHSMGGAVAYEVARLMIERNLPRPSAVVISSIPPPDFSIWSTTQRLHLLSDEDFVLEASKLGWFPKEAVGNPELTRIMLPNLREDIKLYEKYKEGYILAESESNQRGHSYKSIIDARLYLVGGENDISVPIESMEGWSKFFAAPASMLMDGKKQQSVLHEEEEKEEKEEDKSATTSAAASSTAASSLTSVPNQGHFHLHTEETFAVLLQACNNSIVGRRDSVAVGRHIAYEDESLCVHEMFSRQALKTPNATCVVDQRRGVVTFQEAMEEIYLLSSWLRHHGVGVGLDGVVGILSPTTADYLIAIFSVLQSGGSVLPFYTNYTKDLISALVISANVKFMIIDESMDQSCVPNGCPYFCLRAGWKEKLELLSNETTGFILKTQPPVVPTSSCAMLAMTSGSTGTPKAIVVSHQATVISCCVR